MTFVGREASVGDEGRGRWELVMKVEGGGSWSACLRALDVRSTLP